MEGDGASASTPRVTRFLDGASRLLAYDLRSRGVTQDRERPSERCTLALTPSSADESGRAALAATPPRRRAEHAGRPDARSRRPPKLRLGGKIRSVVGGVLISLTVAHRVRRRTRDVGYPRRQAALPGGKGASTVFVGTKSGSSLRFRSRSMKRVSWSPAAGQRGSLAITRRRKSTMVDKLDIQNCLSTGASQNMPAASTSSPATSCVRKPARACVHPSSSRFAQDVQKARPPRARQVKSVRRQPQ